jgi:mRNA-degrading endonuclease toxin of MazEF toxin-antitoxin module
VPELVRGRIVWVELLDPQGRNPKRRPAVVLTATEEIATSDLIAVVAVSTAVSESPREHCVELPWHRQHHPRTRLSERCVAVCNWVEAVPKEAVEITGGVVPGKPLLEILRKVAELRPSFM